MAAPFKAKTYSGPSYPAGRTLSRPQTHSRLSFVSERSSVVSMRPARWPPVARLEADAFVRHESAAEAGADEAKATEAAEDE